MSASSDSTRPVRPEQIPIFPNDISQPSSSSLSPGPEAGAAPENRHDEPIDVEENFGDTARISRRTPMAPTANERDSHEACGHAIFRSWCGPCIMGRGRSVGHYGRARDEGEVPVISWDYGFLGSRNPEGGASPDEDSSAWSPVLCGRDRSSQACY